MAVHVFLQRATVSMYTYMSLTKLFAKKMVLCLRPVIFPLPPPPRQTVAKYLLSAKKRARTETSDARDLLLENLDGTQSLKRFPDTDYSRQADLPDDTYFHNLRGGNRRKTFNLSRHFLQI